MSVFKSEFSVALAVIPSDDALIPNPYAIASGSTTSDGTNLLIDDNALFITNNVAVGDVVYNTTGSTAATVVEVYAEEALLLNANIFGGADLEYTIYQNSPQSGLPNQGCNLYIGVGGNVNVVTKGQNEVSFDGAIAGLVLPIQVVQVKSTVTGTAATSIIALW